MNIRLISSGKSAVLGGQINADLYVDCRVIHNPYRDPVLGGLTGDHPKVQQWILTNNLEFLRALVKIIKLGLKTSSSRGSFTKDPLKPFTVAFFCLAGVHRSRGVKNVLGSMLKTDPELAGHKIEVIK